MPQTNSDVSNNFHFTKSRLGKIFISAIMIIFVIAFLFALLVGYYLWQIKYGNGERYAPKYYSEKFSEAYKTNIEALKIDADTTLYIRDHNPVIGSKDAPITILAFTDYQCPYCKESYFKINSLMKKYDGAIKLVIKQFPFDSLHPGSSELANNALCASKQKKYSEIENKFFTDENFVKSTLAEQAETLNLIPNQYIYCSQNMEHNLDIIQDARDGISLGVRGTPTYFINNVKIEGVVEDEILDMIIIGELDN